MINKIYSMLGLCMKAGKLTAGADVCIENIKKKKAFLIIVAEDASDNTKEKFINIANQYNKEIIIWGKKEDLSKSIGKVDKVVFTILDEGFSNKIIQMLKESKGAIK